MRNVLRRTAALFLALLAVMTLLPFSAFADGGTDAAADKKGKLTIQYYWEGKTPVSGSTFDLYRVADKEWKLVGGFTRYEKQIDFGGKGSDFWDGLASMLKGFVNNDRNLQPVKSGTTDSNGRVTLTDIEPGLYLGIGSNTTVNNKVYTPVPFMVFLPNNDTAGDPYDVTVRPKSDRTHVKVDPPVQKRIEGSPSSRAKFDFSLTRRNSSYPMPEGSNGDTKWISTYGAEWKEFGDIVFTEPGDYIYDIREQNNGVSGYTYDTQVYTITFRVREVNGALTVTEEWKSSKGQTVTGNCAVFTNYYKDPGPKLPQTGQLWWPVPILAVLGAAFLTVGIIRRRRNAE